VLGSPLFERATVDLGGGRSFTVKATGVSERNRHVKAAVLDGRSHPRAWISHQELAKRGVLELQMGPAPNREWGVGPADAPPAP
jgi:putative alpha-1,2-mannosidase